MENNRTQPEELKKLTLKEKIITLLKLNNSPQGIALGVSIGVFICILPLYGLHTILVILAAVTIKRANKIAILLGTNVSLPPTLPLITWAGYSIGKVILGKNYPTLRLTDIRHLTKETIIQFYYPLFIGSVIEGLILAVIFYFIALYVAKKLKI
jgi:uncharacterized protein (DUF2062 family)